MTRSRLMITAALLTAVGLVAPADAGQRQGPGRGAGRVSGAPRAISRPPVAGPYRANGYPRNYGYPRHYGYPYRYGYPYYSYPYYPGFGFGASFGFGSGFGFGIGVAYGYPAYYGYPVYGYAGYGRGYYGYGYPGYVAAAPSRAYGGIVLQAAPRGAQVFADGHYVGVVEDFDGTRDQLSLGAGVHRIEIRAAGSQTEVVDVNVQPRQTIVYQAQMRQLELRE